MSTLDPRAHELLAELVDRIQTPHRGPSWRMLAALKLRDHLETIRPKTDAEIRDEILTSGEGVRVWASTQEQDDADRDLLHLCDVIERMATNTEMDPDGAAWLLEFWHGQQPALHEPDLQLLAVLAKNPTRKFTPTALEKRPRLGTRKYIAQCLRKLAACRLVEPPPGKTRGWKVTQRGLAIFSEQIQS